MGKKLVSSEISPADKKVVELAGHGDQHVWEMAFFRRMDFEAHIKHGERLGKGYAMLTSGKKIFFEFPLLGDAGWQLVLAQPPQM